MQRIVVFHSGMLRTYVLRSFVFRTTLVLFPDKMMAKIRDVTHMDLKLYEAALKVYNEVGGVIDKDYMRQTLAERWRCLGMTVTGDGA